MGATPESSSRRSGDEGFSRFRRASALPAARPSRSARSTGCTWATGRCSNGWSGRPPQECESVVLTFEPHPRVTLGRDEGLRLLTTLEEKTALLAASGVDALVVIPFDRSFSTLSGAEFLDRYLIGKIGAETLVVGYNHRFGHDRPIAGSWPKNGVVARLRR